MDDILDVIDCKGTAYWRKRKAAQYPDDARNWDAVAELERLDPQIEALKGSPLAIKLNQLFGARDPDQDLVMMEAIGVIVRGIGLSGFYSDGEDLLQTIVDACEEELRKFK